MGYASGFGLFVGLGTAIVGLALILPSLAVAVRRLHDTDRSCRWWLIAVIPIIGWLVLIFFLASPGTPAPTRYGPSPINDAMAGRYDLPPGRQ